MATPSPKARRRLTTSAQYPEQVPPLVLHGPIRGPEAKAQGVQDQEVVHGAICPVEEVALRLPGRQDHVVPHQPPGDVLDRGLVDGDVPAPGRNVAGFFQQGISRQQRHGNASVVRTTRPHVYIRKRGRRGFTLMRPKTTKGVVARCAEARGGDCKTAIMAADARRGGDRGRRAPPVREVQLLQGGPRLAPPRPGGSPAPEGGVRRGGGGARQRDGAPQLLAGGAPGRRGPAPVAHRG